MSYDVQIYLKETMLKEKEAKNEDFWDDENNLVPFTGEQKQELHDRLLTYEYVVVNERDGNTNYRHPEGLGISVLLTDRALYFSSTGEGVFEISMTASEFTDDEAFAKYDPQNNGWEEIV
jgi:hypothetical protein